MLHLVALGHVIEVAQPLIPFIDPDSAPSLLLRPPRTVPSYSLAPEKLDTMGIFSSRTASTAQPDLSGRVLMVTGAK
jgi:hypothetical protein